MTSNVMSDHSRPHLSALPAEQWRRRGLSPCRYRLHCGEKMQICKMHDGHQGQGKLHGRLRVDRVGNNKAASSPTETES